MTHFCNLNLYSLGLHSTLKKFVNIIWKLTCILNVLGLCSHMRACEIWTASIVNPQLFQAYKYDSWYKFMINKGYGLWGYPMGIAANSSMPSGKYYLYLNYSQILPYLQTRTNIINSFV